MKMFTRLMMFFLLFVTCRTVAGTESVPTAFQSMTTSLDPMACQDEVDPESADDVHRLRCPGIGGYALIPTVDDVRQETVTLITPQKEEIMLEYGTNVPSHDCRLDKKVEWRETTLSGKPVPQALIIHLRSYEVALDSNTLLQSYWIIAKITSTQSCVTDSKVDDNQSPAQIRQLADTAQARPCL